MYIYIYIFYIYINIYNIYIYVQYIYPIYILYIYIIYIIYIFIYIRAKNSNLEQPTSKLFPPWPRFGNRHENLEKRPVNEPTKFDTTDTLLAHIEKLPPKTRSDNFRRILEGMKRTDLRKLASNATDELKTCDDTKKRCCELIIDIFWLRCLKQTKRYRKSVLPLRLRCFSITKD